MRKSFGAIAFVGTAAALGVVMFGGVASAAPVDPPPANPLTYTLDFTNTTFDPVKDVVGSGFVGSGTVTDSSGTNVGTVVDTCYEVEDESGVPLVSCTVDMKLSDGSIQLSAVGPIDPNKADFPYSFDGIVDGGTGNYDGAHGDCTFDATVPATYAVTINLLS